MLGKKEEEEEEEKEGEKEETLSTLLEDMQSVVASFLDPASLCALALSSRHFFFKFFKSNAFWGPNLTTLCLRNGHVGLFKYALETLKAPLAQEEVVVHAALSSPSPFPLAFVEYLLRNVKSGFGFTTHPMPSEVYKATSKFLALIARVARDLSPKEFLLHPSFASMLDLISPLYHIRLYHAFIEGNCFELMKFISYGMWKRLNFPKGKVKGEEGIEEEKGNSVFEFLTMMQESSKNDRPTLAADNIKMFLLMRNLDVESFQEEDDYVEIKAEIDDMLGNMGQGLAPLRANLAKWVALGGLREDFLYQEDLMVILPSLIETEDVDTLDKLLTYAEAHGLGLSYEMAFLLVNLNRPVPNSCRIISSHSKEARAGFTEAIAEQPNFFWESDWRGLTDEEQALSDEKYLECLRIVWKATPTREALLSLISIPREMRPLKVIPIETAIKELGSLALIKFLLYEQEDFPVTKVITLQNFLRTYSQEDGISLRHLKILKFLKDEGSFEFKVDPTFFEKFHLGRFSSFTSIFGDPKGLQLVSDLFGNEVFLLSDTHTLESFIFWFGDIRLRKVPIAEALRILELIAEKAGGKLTIGDPAAVNSWIESSVKRSYAKEALKATLKKITATRA